jgi:DNA recombination protein Rad52
MGFSAKQLHALRRHVDERWVRTREINGRELSYIEGWYAISQANRIFGFDGWSRETLDSKCVLARENRGNFIAVYTAKVRVTVTAGDAQVFREGHGTGEARADSPGEVHDTALKAAETDATKRALATFGRPFGLELYVKRTDVRCSPSKIVVPSGQQVDGAFSDQPSASPGSVGAELHPNKIQAPSVSPENGSTYTENLAAAPALPSDHSPIRRPSRHFGRERYLANRQHIGSLMQEAKKTAEASIVPGPPDLVGPNRIDKSVLPFGEPKRIRDKAHLKFVASQPCLVCGRQPADAHHLRFAQPRALGLKVSDEFTVPLCRVHHRQLHQTGNEAGWWEDLEINAMEIAKTLWEQSHQRAG